MILKTKKMYLILIVIFSIFNVSAKNFIEDRHYFKNRHTIHNIPKVLEFFSFFCPYCYTLAKYNAINKKMLSYVKIHYYHTNSNNYLSTIVTRAWSIAIAMNIEKKVMLPIFSGIQITHTIYNYKSLKKTFILASGITSKTFENFWNSTLIKTIFSKQIKIAQLIHLKKIPTIFVNGQYVINNKSIKATSNNKLVKKYIQLIIFLINKK